MKKLTLISALLVLSYLLQAQFMPPATKNFTRQDTLRGSITPERAWWNLTYYHLNIKVNPSDSTIYGTNTVIYKVLTANKVMQIDTQEDLCAWISTALNEFIELVYSSQDARKTTQIRPAINYIDANYDKAITLAEIARASHLSVSRLAHLFKDQMGVTLIDYVTQVRIERAKELLLGTDQSCTDVCFQVGYGNPSYFTRTFKSLAGMTPQQFRLQNRRAAVPPIGP